MYNQNMDIEKQILAPIDDVLAEYERITPAVDARMCIEGQVWAELDESVAQGWRTPEEAQDLFLQWRTDYLAGNI